MSPYAAVSDLNFGCAAVEISPDLCAWLLAGEQGSSLNTAAEQTRQVFPALCGPARHSPNEGYEGAESPEIMKLLALQRFLCAPRIYQPEVQMQCF